MINLPKTHGLTVRDMQILYHSQPDIEAELMAKLAEELTREMDREIVNSLIASRCEMDGWHKIVIKKQTIPREWLEASMKHQWTDLGSVWYFENKNDAAWFALRWS
jgi:hypothetical protein